MFWIEEVGLCTRIAFGMRSRALRPKLDDPQLGASKPECKCPALTKHNLASIPRTHWGGARLFQTFILPQYTDTRLIYGMTQLTRQAGTLAPHRVCARHALWF
jgi:hypothetical protein